MRTHSNRPLAAVQQSAEDASAARPPRRRAVGVLLFDDVEVLDFAGPFDVFARTRLIGGIESRRSEESAPFRVFTVARDRRPITATGGLVVTPTHGFADAPAIDLLVVPGGFGTRSLMGDREVLDWIRRVAAEAELVTAVCTGALVAAPVVASRDTPCWSLLGRAGLLAGRRATTHWGALDLLESMGDGIVVDRARRVVDDGGVVTSAGVAAGIDMAFHVVEALCGRQVAAETARYLEYRRQR